MTKLQNAERFAGEPPPSPVKIVAYVDALGVVVLTATAVGAESQTFTRGRKLYLDHCALYHDVAAMVRKPRHLRRCSHDGAS